MLIRIAHLLPFAGVGGTEQMVLNLCKFRDSSRFTYRVAAPHEGAILREIRETGVEVRTGSGASREAVAWSDLTNLHACGYSPAPHTMVEAAGKPYVTTLHTLTTFPPVGGITVCTSDTLYERQAVKERFLSIPNGVDLTRFFPRPKETRPEVVIACVCRMEKCALYFWPTMKRVLDRYPKAHLWVVGNEAETGSPHERIRFWGIRRDVPEILARCDLFAYAPYPAVGTKDLVLMEALATGLPCVTTDVDAARESVEGGTDGFLVPFGDGDAFAESVGRLIEDAPLRERMGAHAAVRSREQFDMRVITGRYELLYREVLAAYRGRS